jgi:divalent metal cation (Fe/Co/Zn/Cd) transporter
MPAQTWRIAIEQGHEVAGDVRHSLLHELRYPSHATVHVDPATAPDEIHDRIVEHPHDGFLAHSH